MCVCVHVRSLFAHLLVLSLPSSLHIHTHTHTHTVFTSPAEAVRLCESSAASIRWKSVCARVCGEGGGARVSRAGARADVCVLECVCVYTQARAFVCVCVPGI